MDDAIKTYLADLDRAVVARGGTSVFAPKPQGSVWAVNRALFLSWEREKLDGNASPELKTDGNYRFHKFSAWNR